MPDLERSLRTALPDEPVTPPLEGLDRPLPEAPSVRGGGFGLSRRIVLIACVLILAVAGVAVAQISRSSVVAPASPTAAEAPAASGQATSGTPAALSPAPAAMTLDGTLPYTIGPVAFRTSPGWFAAGSEVPGRFNAPPTAIANFDVVARCPDAANPGAVDAECVGALVLLPGEVTVVVTAVSFPRFDVAEPAGGWRSFVGGLPAIFSLIGPESWSNADEIRGWRVLTASNTYEFDIVARLRGPGLDRLRAQVDSLVASITFPAIPPLPTGAAGSTAMAAAARSTLDTLDRQAREDARSTFYSCFPRQPGTSAGAVIDDAPAWHLAVRLPVTCSVGVRPTVFQAWEMTLTVTWGSGPGYAAGTYRERYELDANTPDQWRARGPAMSFPTIVPDATPGPVSTVLHLPVGSFVRVLAPGISVHGAPSLGADYLADQGRGELLYIVSGPRVVKGAPWYRVQWQPTASFDGVPGWIPAVLDGHPTVSPAEPCPARAEEWDVTALVALHPAARLACVGPRELTLGPVTMGTGDNIVVGGTPAWLATQSTIRMFGSGGPTGLDGSIWVVPAPGLAALPLGTWLTVTGHFDDPAAAACERTTPSTGDTLPETTVEQVLHCREQFVITSATPAVAPPGASPAPAP